MAWYGWMGIPNVTRRRAEIGYEVRRAKRSWSPWSSATSVRAGGDHGYEAKVMSRCMDGGEDR